ncbi:hypothetical protein BH09MYX1_BH09MYX1_43610 [soil metagenome]
MKWHERIVQLVLIKQRLAEVDRDKLWPHHLLAVAATEADIQAVERHLGEAIDPTYRAFLRKAAGWNSFFQAVDLFGPSDLVVGSKWQLGQDALASLEENVIGDMGFDRDELLPIAASPTQLDLFVMAKRESSEPGAVIWIAGYEVDRYPTFADYFDAMVAYNEREVRALMNA